MVAKNQFGDETFVEGMTKKVEHTRGKIKIMNGLYKNKEILINVPCFTIGRSSDCALSIHDKKASRIHAQLIESMGKEIIEDMGSSNGTKVNGRSVTKRILKDGDMIEIGNTSLQYIE